MTMERLKFYIPGHGVPAETEYVIGEPKYSTRDDQVVMLAKGDWVGCPVNAMHCTPISGGHEDLAAPMRERYERLYPGFLAALPKSA